MLPTLCSWVSTSTIRPPGLGSGYEAIPLGRVRVTKYTHHEGGPITATGHRLKPEDEGKLCAVSRDWWKSVVKPGDQVWVVGHAQPCVALDTMAIKNRKGLRQRRWVDIYITDRRKGLDFGIQRSTAYLIRRVRVPK